MLAAIIATALGFAPPLGQAPPADKEQPSPSIAGLSVYSKDGQKLGEVTDVGTVEGEAVVLAQFGDFLGLRTRPVLIPADMIIQKNDGIGVPMDAEEIKTMLTKPAE